MPLNKTVITIREIIINNKTIIVIPFWEKVLKDASTG